MDIIYTPTPLELVLKNPQEQTEFNYKYINYNGIEMQVEPLEENRFKVIRLYSTEPNHYLDQSLQPGAIISGQWDL